MMQASISHRIPFHDTDAMGIVWHGNYYKYFEIARSHLKSMIGIDAPDLVKIGYAMPVVLSSARYIQSLKYGDEVLLHAIMPDPFYPALEIKYRITSKDGKLLYAEGSTKQVYLSIETHETCFRTPEKIEKILKEAHERFQSNF